MAYNLSSIWDLREKLTLDMPIDLLITMADRVSTQQRSLSGEAWRKSERKNASTDTRLSEERRARYYAAEADKYRAFADMMRDYTSAEAIRIADVEEAEASASNLLNLYQQATGIQK